MGGPTKQAGAELKKKKRIFGPKIGKKIENKVQKLSNFKDKKDFFGQKNKLRLRLRTKKGLFLAKILTKIELKGKKFENKVQKLSNFKGKKDFFWPKKPAGAELKNKKGHFWAKILIKIEFKGQNWEKKF